MSFLEKPDGVSSPIDTPISLTVRCGSYSNAGPSCFQEVTVVGLGAISAGQTRFISDHDPDQGLALYAFCKEGHTLTIGHIDTIPVLGLSASSFKQMSEDAVDLSGLTRFISSLSS